MVGRRECRRSARSAAWPTSRPARPAARRRSARRSSPAATAPRRTSRPGGACVEPLDRAEREARRRRGRRRRRRAAGPSRPDRPAAPAAGPARARGPCRPARAAPASLASQPHPQPAGAAARRVVELHGLDRDAPPVRQQLRRRARCRSARRLASAGSSSGGAVAVANCADAKPMAAGGQRHARAARAHTATSRAARRQRCGHRDRQPSHQRRLGAQREVAQHAGAHEHRQPQREPAALGRDPGPARRRSACDATRTATICCTRGSR